MAKLILKYSSFLFVGDINLVKNKEIEVSVDSLSQKDIKVLNRYITSGGIVSDVGLLPEKEEVVIEDVQLDVKAKVQEETPVEKEVEKEEVKEESEEKSEEETENEAEDESTEDMEKTEEKTSAKKPTRRTTRKK